MENHVAFLIPPFNNFFLLVQVFFRLLRQTNWQDLSAELQRLVELDQGYVVICDA